MSPMFLRDMVKSMTATPTTGEFKTWRHRPFSMELVAEVLLSKISYSYSYGACDCYDSYDSFKMVMMVMTVMKFMIMVMLGMIVLMTRIEIKVM
jgi:hypothetical protein